MRYRRVKTPGGTYFFTVNLATRTSSLLIDRIDALRNAVRQVKAQHPFRILAWAVLPDHMHAIWVMPEHDGDYSNRWKLIKQRFSKSIERTEAVSSSRQHKGERNIWQRRFWEHQIRDERDLQSHVDYVHINPVKHGHVNRASDWPYSSIHRYIRAGMVTPDWACPIHEINTSGEAGPRKLR
ncbi:REP-associated tyrosine transposase [Dyella acidiphila]|uniref:Transposase n=1 Tax=Dyella acidiphila TaxID=2775866 RepID=A0ABR9G7T2_9GAMM|nr:transposase [Dyella acidiphila]MBE1160086.1 transposase [Dyella acidiphila]